MKLSKLVLAAMLTATAGAHAQTNNSTPTKVSEKNTVVKKPKKSKSTKTHEKVKEKNQQVKADKCPTCGRG